MKHSEGRLIPAVTRLTPELAALRTEVRNRGAAGRRCSGPGHRVADRQIAPTLLKFGAETQKQRFLPAIARGECYFGIARSEPDSDSDLTSVRTRAVQVDGSWRVN